MLHSRLLPSDNHPFHRWEFSNSAARLAATTVATTDCGKVAWEINTNTFWILTSASPITWTALGTAPVAASSASVGDAIVVRNSSGSFAANVITATLTGNVSGNATTASRLFTPRTIALTGDVTGTATFDGSANLTIATTAAPPQTVSIGSINATGNGITASVVGTTATISSNATANAVANTIVSRDGAGSFAANVITATTVTGALVGNAATASRLFTPRTIALTGAVTGTATFDGSANLSITTTSTQSAGIAGIGVSGIGLSTSVVGGISYVSSNATASNTANTLASRDSIGSLAVTSIRLPHGAAPTTPTDGELWTTTTGLYGHINGTTATFITDTAMSSYVNATVGSGFVSKTGDTMSGGLTINGALSATTKNFLIPHPTKPDTMLRYGSLEGPENGIYVRGKTTSSVIELPEYWTKLVDPNSITVSLTAIGSPQDLIVAGVWENKVFIINSADVGAINCYYHIFAERCDVEKLQTEAPNRRT